MHIKGQLISKGLLGIFNSSKKWTKKFDWYLRSICFRSFFVKFEDSKKTFQNKMTFEHECIVSRVKIWGMEFLVYGYKIRKFSKKKLYYVLKLIVHNHPGHHVISKNIRIRPNSISPNFSKLKIFILAHKCLQFIAETTDFGHTISLRPKFKSQSQMNIWDVDIKA